MTVLLEGTFPTSYPKIFAHNTPPYDHFFIVLLPEIRTNCPLGYAVEEDHDSDATRVSAPMLAQILDVELLKGKHQT